VGGIEKFARYSAEKGSGDKKFWELILLIIIRKFGMWDFALYICASVNNEESVISIAVYALATDACNFALICYLWHIEWCFVEVFHMSEC